jgi:predicted nucleic acid-binding protein
MVSKLFLDTNILFDVIDISRPNSDNVKKMFYICEENNLSFFVSAITINNIVYVMQSKFKMSTFELKKRLENLFQLVEIVPFDMEVLIDGLKLDFEDVEDSFQFVSALKCQAGFLITEDGKFLRKNICHEKIKVMNTFEFLTII